MSSGAPELSWGARILVATLSLPRVHLLRMRFLWPRFFHPVRWGETKLPPKLGCRSLSPATELQTENIRAIFPQSCKQQLSRICGAFQVFAQSNHVCNFRSPCWFFSLPFLSGEPSCQAWISLESGRRPGTAVLRVSSTFGQRCLHHTGCSLCSFYSLFQTLSRSVVFFLACTKLVSSLFPTTGDP